MSTNKSDWVVVGRFGRPHGIKGLITAFSYTEPYENLLEYHPWYVETDSGYARLPVKKTSISPKGILVAIEGYDDRDSVAIYKNKAIAVKATQLPELSADAFYWHDLIGMRVVNHDGTLLGTVTEIMPTGSNDVLVVEGENRYLIPYLPDEVIVHINLDEGHIDVDWDVNF